MSNQEPEYVARVIQSPKLYDSLYSTKDLRKEGQLIDMETRQLIQGIVLGDQEDKRFIGKQFT